MRTHIDWLTFTITPQYSEGSQEGYTNAVIEGLNDLFGVKLADSAFGGNWSVKERSRAPYTDAWQLGECGITLFASPNLTHACVEISGAGCEYLIEHNLLNELLTKCSDRVTRIDIATDIETNVNPTEFVSITNHERMRSNGYQTSESGETCYVGSKTSDRYARVYRYFAPHPRSHLLRIEHVFRRKYAKSVSRACVNTGTQEVAKAAGKVFGWSHPEWQPSVSTSADISIIRENRQMGGTIHWLITACAPAFKRLCDEGTIRDPEKFLRDYFIPLRGE